MRSELRRIDEYRDNHAIGAALRPAHQRKMPLVQRTHGRHQANRAASPTEIGEGAAQRREGADNLGLTLRSLGNLHDDVAA